MRLTFLFLIFLVFPFRRLILLYQQVCNHDSQKKKKKNSKCSYENCVHIPRHDNKVTRVRATLLTQELKLNGGQADFYSGTRRAHKADGIAGSKFEIFCRHFSSLRPRPLSAFLFFISLTHTRFWHAFQSGWLPRKPRNRSVTRTIEEVKGDFDSFSKRERWTSNEKLSYSSMKYTK